MMTSIKKLGNGFKIQERKLENSEVELTVEILKDGIYVTSEKFENVSKQEENKIIANYLATQMKLYCVEEEVTSEERVRLAGKAMGLNIINGYKINPLEDGNYSNIRVELLESGRYPMYTTGICCLTKENLEELKKKLNRIVEYQLDIRKQTRPLYGIEIIQMIS
mgnify:CR=1 FL=1